MIKREGPLFFRLPAIPLELRFCKLFLMSELTLQQETTMETRSCILQRKTVKYGAVGRVRIVLSVISDLNHRNEYGKTALDRALRRNTSKVLHGYYMDWREADEKRIFNIHKGEGPDEKV